MRRNRLRWMLPMMGGGGAPATFSLTCTTTGAQTLTLNRLNVKTGTTCTVDWGDGNSDTYSPGTGTRTHAYAGAGTWTVRLLQPENVTELDLGDTKLSGTINAANPLPAGLTSLYLAALFGLTYNANTTPLPTGLTTLFLNALPGLTYNVNADPLPTRLTYLYLRSLAGLTYNANTDPFPTELTTLYLQDLAGLTWDINGSQPWPTGATTAQVIACPNVTVSAWTDNAINSIRIESALSQAQVDSIVNAIWANKANFTYATPSLDILGVGMAAPSGTYQEASPPTTGKEKIYDLVNGNYTPAGPEWTISYQT